MTCQARPPIQRDRMAEFDRFRHSQSPKSCTPAGIGFLAIDCNVGIE